MMLVCAENRIERKLLMMIRVVVNGGCPAPPPHYHPRLVGIQCGFVVYKARAAKCWLQCNGWGFRPMGNTWLRFRAVEMIVKTQE